MDRSGRATFKANPELQRILKELQLFYGLSTRSPLLQHIIPDILFSIYKSPIPKNLTAKQKRAYKRITKYVDSIRKELKKAEARYNKKSHQKNNNLIFRRT
ncbi:MAG: hypothetical protein ACETWQ_22515 [Phycisphaerae bacterium]